MRIEHDQEKNKFEAYDDSGARMGEIAYVPRRGALSANHTWVSDEFRGRGVAGKLLDALVAFAVAGDLKIIPICSYVASAFEKNPERYREVME